MSFLGTTRETLRIRAALRAERLGDGDAAVRDAGRGVVPPGPRAVLRPRV